MTIHADATRWGITGHIDLGPDTRRLVAAALISEMVDRLPEAPGGLVGVTNLAGGSDQVFAWLVAAFGGGIEFVRPCAQIEETVDGDDLRGMRAGSALATHTVPLAFDKPSEEAFLAAGHEVVDRCHTLFAVWNGAPAVGRGGTGDVVEHARSSGREVVVVWPSGAKRG